jgi:hypothetical protein
MSDIINQKIKNLLSGVDPKSFVIGLIDEKSGNVKVFTEGEKLEIVFIERIICQAITRMITGEMKDER